MLPELLEAESILVKVVSCIHALAISIMLDTDLLWYSHVLFVVRCLELHNYCDELQLLAIGMQLEIYKLEQRLWV